MEAKNTDLVTEEKLVECLKERGKNEIRGLRARDLSVKETKQMKMTS